MSASNFVGEVTSAATVLSGYIFTGAVAAVVVFVALLVVSYVLVTMKGVAFSKELGRQAWNKGGGVVIRKGVRRLF